MNTNGHNEQRVSVVIPFLNEKDNLPELLDRLKKVFDAQPETAEWVLVDDGSDDGGPEYLMEQKAREPRIRLLRLSRNFGHQAAISAGLDRATGDAVVIMDADLQDPPEVIGDFLARWREGCEVVYGVRSSREGDGAMKKLLAAGFYRIFHWLSPVQVPVDSGDFRLLDRVVVDALKSMRETHRYLRAMTSWVGFRQCAVTYKREARHAGVTKYPVAKSLALAWDGLTSFSGRPLRVMSAVGTVFFLFGVLWAVQIVISKLMHPNVPERGWVSVMAAILILGGIQLLSLGLVGQYLSRTYEEAKKRPLYVVRSDTGA